MPSILFRTFSLTILAILTASSGGELYDEAGAVEFLTELETNYSIACNTQITARWAYITNVTDETEQASVSQAYNFRQKTLLNTYRTELQNLRICFSGGGPK
jgi:hypothetical protein